MRPITLVLPFFANLGMLAEQQAVWADYPDWMKALLHVVVVDDCSPKEQCPSAASVTLHDLASFHIYRLLEKKRWNWLACRNLGAKVARTDWLLLTDIDHVIPASTFERLMRGPLVPEDVYRFKRVTTTGRWPYDVKAQPAYKPHNDTWFLTRKMFFYDDGKKFVCGYDSRLSDLYGTSGEFRDRLVAAAHASVILDNVIIRYPREIIADASTPPSVYTRKGDPANDAELARRKAERAKIPNWRPLHGLIESELVYSSLRAEVAVA